MKIAPIAKAATAAGVLVVKYGPQAKLAWDNGGRQTAEAARKRAMSLNARRKALNHASGLVEGTILKVAPAGRTVYVVFSGDRPVGAYPEQEAPLASLLENADLDKRVHPDKATKSLRRPGSSVSKA
ncbi:hypothetical protein [Nocardioides sp.]|uniref:hypothetical protein n=1 Tax=Nocardioides sp. TaxID=35761 RepID=UPI003D0F6412